ncbi:hypothetical protein IFT48_03940 [Pseudomonas fluorescens]|uniref:hypothetical protein n=1 Tax=Pseudomonas fluorescens TaxID=294 RepID=UPI001930A3BC|nr:hypothetical protein [Pseudomonas fluorescens]MBD8089122.1 hypothetical protein [Pseudomonas fluorescens]
MPNFDLYSQSPNPTPEQLIKVCDDLMSHIKSAENRPKIEDVLTATESLAEQILGHYQNLPAVAQEVSAFARQGQKMPYQLMNVFFYACVREHPSLNTMLNEVHAVYGDEQDRTAFASLKGMLQDSALMLMPRPTLWDAEGVLKYNPKAFSHMHSRTYLRQVSALFAEGEAGVQKILDAYPMLDDASRAMLDEDLIRRVYRSVVADDDPVRWLLRERLNTVEDGLVRFEKLFDLVDRDDDVGGFEDRFEHAFSLVESLPKDQANEVLMGISKCIREWMTDDSGLVRNLDEPELVIPRLVRVLERARPFGIDGLAEVAKHTLSSAKESPALLVGFILDGGFDTGSNDLDTPTAWVEAAVVACEEDFLLSLGLDERHLAKLTRYKGTPGLRQALLKSDTGRAIVFGQDLGL